MTSNSPSGKGIFGSAGQYPSRLAKQGAVEESKPLIEGCKDKGGKQNIANWHPKGTVPVPGTRDTTHPPNAKKFLRVDAKGQLLHIYVRSLSKRTHIECKDHLHACAILARTTICCTVDFPSNLDSLFPPTPWTLGHTCMFWSAHMMWRFLQCHVHMHQNGHLPLIHFWYCWSNRLSLLVYLHSRATSEHQSFYLVLPGLGRHAKW
jgi:hypothetical protein